MAQKLTVYETGPDGDSTYQITVGDEISVEDAREVIERSGRTEVYAMHHYEAGERIESFISKTMYDQLCIAIGNIPTPRTLAQIKTDIDQRSRKTLSPWWAFWHR
jgi:hypothetical protein